MGLPKCDSCDNEVKPGEDECWGCLGEREPIDYAYFLVSDLAGNDIGYGSYPIAVGTSTYTTTTYVPAYQVNAITVFGTTITLSSPIIMTSGDTFSITVNATM